MMGECNNSDFFAAKIVDDAIGKLSYREAAPTVSPRRAELWVRTKKFEYSFVFRNECKTNLSVPFAGVEQGAFG